MPEIKICRIELTHKLYLTPNIVELRFTKPEGFTYLPGQFIQTYIPTTTPPTVRSYSVSSLPHQDYLELCIKILPGGIASAFFAGLQVGEKVDVTGPNGRFTLAGEDTSRAFVATGTGFAPVIALAESAAKISPEKVMVLFGVRNEADIFWANRLETLKNLYGNFDYAITLSQPSENWVGKRGRVTEHVLEVSGSSAYYLCGSLEMVKEVRGNLIKNNVINKNIHFEIF